MRGVLIGVSNAKGQKSSPEISMSKTLQNFDLWGLRIVKHER